MTPQDAAATAGSPRYYRVPITIWIAVAVAAVAAWFAFREGVAYMVHVWEHKEEYSHAYIIPAISAFLIWQRKNELAAMEFRGSWAGVAVIVVGLFLGLLGQLSAVYTMQQIGFVTAICGFVLALTGFGALRLLWMPLLLLFFMIPLPNFLQQNFSAGMQLWSSQLGVWFVRLLGISVYLEGNVIDLGTYKLQVVEACDGLRYMFPLMTLGLVMAYFYKGALWKRVLIFFSSIPLTILMNSLRIGMIGWMVEHWGPSMAEGFVHDFQGWAVFMSSLGLMVLLMILLSRIGRDGRPWRELFGVEFPEPLPKGTAFAQRRLQPTVIAACVLMAAGALVTMTVPHRAEAVPDRKSFVDFPMVIGQWFGERQGMDAEIIQTLALNDYVMANYRGPAPRGVNFYVAWYDSQRAGRSVHSPRTCLPGGGWQIVEFDQVTVPGVEAAGQPLRVNRAVIGLGSQRQLVYYWFQQRGRIITNEYLAKWYLFWDSLTRNRTDGALVRLVVPVDESEQTANADQDLERFSAAVVPVLEDYIPR
jgi:exosortase D (VPLPA-CTERM-specific)